MEYTPSFYSIAVALPGDEMSVADTDEKVIDLMDIEIQGATEDMADDLGTIFYSDKLKTLFSYMFSVAEPALG